MTQNLDSSQHKRSISSSHKGVLKSQNSRDFNNLDPPQLRSKNSSFHVKREFKFQATVNFNIQKESSEREEPPVERPRFSTLNQPSNSKAEKTTIKRAISIRRNDSSMRVETNGSDIEILRSNVSIDTEGGDPPKFQQVNIFNSNINKSIQAPSSPKNHQGPNSPKNQLKKITLKKSISSQRPSIVSIFSRIKKKDNLDLSDEEDFKCIIAILRKPPHQRTDHEIVLLKSAFGEVKFFEERKLELSTECYDRLFRELKYEFVEKRRPVFNLGDMGRNFYIIIQGTVSILLKKKGLEENPDEKFVKKENEEEDKEGDDGLEKKRKRALLKKILQYENGDTTIKKEAEEISDEDFLNVRYPSFFMMRKMNDGESFGEIALRQNVPRTATILADIDAHFAILTRDSYQNILKIYDDQMINNKIDFLIGIPVFKGWSTASMEQLYKQFRIETFRKNKVFYKEFDPSSFLYFIQTGEVELTKYIELIEEYPKKRSSFHQTESFLPNLKRQIEDNRQRVRIALLGPNEMFGHEEILNRSKRRSKAIVVSSKATIFYIQKEAFFNFVKNYNTVKILESINRLNKEWHESLQSSIQTFFRQGPSAQEKKPMIPYIKGFPLHRKSFSLSKIENNENNLKMTQHSTERPNEERMEIAKKWMSRKIASKEKLKVHNSFKGGHMNEFVASFNDFYEKIEPKLDNSNNNSYGFDNVLIENPFGRHILEVKINKKRKIKEKIHSVEFGRYLSEETKRKIKENHNNNSFFSMNFCQNVLKKKKNPLEQVLLEKISAGKNETKIKIEETNKNILNDLSKNDSEIKI